jgi:ABC-type multidrug transport system permease subunit
MLSLALFFPNLILSGLVWPIEGMPYVLRVVSYFLPQTMAIKSMRSIISRGLGIGEWQVYIGFISSISWALFFILVAIILFASDRRY